MERERGQTRHLYEEGDGRRRGREGVREGGREKKELSKK